MKDILQAGCALRNHINAYEKAGILEKGETRIPARRCEVLLPERTAYGRIVPAFTRLSARSGGSLWTVSVDCLLHSSSHYSTDDPLLGEDVDDEDRGHGPQVGGEGRNNAAVGRLLVK